jgi:outer membrane protein assembly factor BamB
MNKKRSNTKSAARLVLLLMGLFLCMPSERAEASHSTFARGDVFVSLISGQVEWWHPDGTLNQVLVNIEQGEAEGMGFDAAGNLYVTHSCADVSVCVTGNTVEKFNTSGQSVGSFGSDYSCNPSSIVFDGAGRAYVGQKDCTGDILMFNASGVFQAAFDVAPDTRGSAKIDLARDGCTMLYTSWGPNVKRFNICAKQQLSNFNRLPISSGLTMALRILPDGGVLVASKTAIARLDAAGRLIQTYDVPGEQDFWLGLDLVGDGTFWASNNGSGNVYRFDLATGAVRASFTTGTPANSLEPIIQDILVRR